MATIREWLRESGFNWSSGRVIIHPVTKDDDGYEASPGSAGKRELGTPVEVTSAKSHELLDKEFHTGYGAPECPRFVAYDKNRIYFPYQYDGATGLEVVSLYPEDYLGDTFKMTPYPGGG